MLWMYAVILAGGGGTRLWPLSVPERPKPFLPLLPSGSLLQRTVERITQGVHRLQLSDVTVVTDQKYVPLVRAQLPEMSVIAEPMGRNTAAAIALATVAIERPMDDVMVVLPADHLILDEAIFRGVLADACRELALGAFGIDSPIVTLGAEANRPATQYGYLVPDAETSHEANLTAHPLEAFVEKPTPARAESLLKSNPGVAWNAGIFMGRRRAIRDAFDRYTDLIRLLEGAAGSPTALRAAYEGIEPLSIDHAVMERAAADGRVVMGAMEVGWSDVGTWTALIDALSDGYSAEARVVPPTEVISLGADDVCVLRVDEDDHLSLEIGPLTRIFDNDRPMAFLPSARRHADVIRDLLTRVNAWEFSLQPALRQATVA